jgi:putative nucleotidyltransferase with HDIG domain
MFASLFVAGFPGLSLVLPPAIIASAVGVNRPLYKTAFNLAALTLAGGASALVLGAFGSLSDPGGWPQVIIPATAAAAANFFVNSGLVALAISLTGRIALRTVWSEHFMWLWPHYLVLGLLGLAVASATDAMGVWGVAVFLAPPLMMRLSVKQYLDRTTRGVLDLRDAHGELQVAHEKLTHAMNDLGSAYDGTLRSLVAALDARDSETGGHSERVAELTMAIAAELDLDPDGEEWQYIQWGALLHDVGKIAVPDAILRKPEKLSDEEWVTMRGHPRAGFEIICSVEFLAPAAEIVLAHHERFDGAGYPRGLAGEEIPLGARIFMIADTFDAITCERPYKPARPPEEALAEILRNSGTQFDPVAVQAFLNVYRKRFVGKADHSQRLGKIAREQLNEALERAIAEVEAREGLR